MVVFGHCFLGLVRVDLIPYPELMLGILRGFIHPLAMPIFFVLSGMFSVHLAERPWRAVLANRAGGLVYPYVVWVLIHGFALSLAGGLANHRATLSEITYMWYKAPYHYWFLYALFFVSLTYVALRKIGLSNRAIFALSSLLYLTIPFMGVSTWSGAYNTRQHLPYFAFGALIGYQVLDARLARASTRSLALISVAGIGGTLAYAMAVHERPGPYLMVLILAMGGPGLAALAGIMSRRRGFGIVELWGRRSLEIYLAHSIFVAGTRIILMRLGVEHWIPHLLLGTVVGLYVPILMWYAAEAFGMSFVFSLKRRTVPAPRGTPSPAGIGLVSPTSGEMAASRRKLETSAR